MTTTEAKRDQLYTDRKAAIKAELARLMAIAESMDEQPEGLHWGHLGDMGSMLESLQQIAPNKTQMWH